MMRRLVFGPLQIARGRKYAAVPATLIYDTFTDTDNTTLAAHTIAPTNSTGTSWTMYVGAATEIKIVSNATKGTSSGGSVAMAALETGQSNVKLTIRIRHAVESQYQTAPVLRLSDANNLWFVLPQSYSKIRIYERASGSDALRAEKTGLTIPNDWNEYVVTFNGTTITATITGVTGATVSYASATSNQTATKHGSYVRNTEQIDDFKVEPL